jgi:glycosyltransferase involved in cell wall biosynthesis
MALGIPAVVSPVAVNKTIITPGVNGYWCETEQEWVVCLARLIEDAQLRKAIGANGRAMVEKHYSISSNSENFLSLFR